MTHPADQLPIDFAAAAAERAQRGMEAAAGHADRVSAGWTDRALEALTTYANSAGGPFLVEEARAHAEAHGLPAPVEARAWGSVVRAAARGPTPRIRKVGYRAAASSNNSPKCLWEAAR